MSHIFISYSRRDIDFAGKIVEALAKNKLDTWIDWKSIPKGEDWEQEIYRGIEEAEAFLFLISPYSVKSEMCNKEITHAVKNGKRILPIFISNAEVAEVNNEFRDVKSKEEMSRRNYLFCREVTDDFNETIGEIHKIIHTDYEWLRFQTNLQLKALEWERNEFDNSFVLHGKELESAEKVFIANLDKEPHSTELQNQFIAKSRNVENLQIAEKKKTQSRLRNRAITISGIAILAIIAICLAALFGGQVGTSTLNAQQQKKNALANQLSAQAQSIYIDGDSRQEVSVLLAIQSMKIFPSVQASQILMTNSLAIPIMDVATSPYEGKTEVIVAFSPDGKYFYTGTNDFERVWDLANGQEVSNYFDNNYVEFARFTSDSKYIISMGNNNIHIWNVITGDETTPIMLDNNLIKNISAIDVTTDGKYIVFVADQTAYIWEVSSKRVVAKKSSDLGSISAVAFSPDGRYLAYASHSIIGIWNATTGEEMGTTKKDSPTVNEPINHLEFSPDGNFILSSNFSYGTDSVVRIWDANKYSQIVSVIHNGLVESVSFSPNSKYVVTGCSDHIARVLEVATGKVISQMTHDGDVLSVAFSPDSKYVISGSDDQTARVWEVATGKETARMTHNDSVISVAFSPNGKYVGSGSLDNIARVWEPIVKNEVSNMNIYGDIDSDVISPDQKYVAARSVSDHIFHVWEMTSGKETSKFNHEENISSIAISPNNKYIVFGGWDGNGFDEPYGTVVVRALTTGQEISRMVHQLPNPGYPEATVRSVAFSPDSRYVVSGSWDQTARVWDVPTGKEIARMTYDDFEDKVNSVAFSPDGKYVVSGTNNFGTAAVRVWEASTGKEITRMYANAQSIVFSPDGTYVAIAGSGAWSLEQSASLWDVATGEAIAYMNHDDNVSLVIFSPDGKFIASGSDDNTARVWNISTGEEVSRMTYTAKLNSIAFSPDGRYVVSGSDDKTARVWEADTGKEIARSTHNDPVNLVSFSQNGKYVLSGSIGKLHTWMWQPEDLIANACSRVTRNLTQDEWKQYVGNVMPFRPVCPNLLLETEIVPSVRLKDLIKEFYRK